MRGSKHFPHARSRHTGEAWQAVTWPCTFTRLVLRLLQSMSTLRALDSSLADTQPSLLTLLATFFSRELLNLSSPPTSDLPVASPYNLHISDLFLTRPSVSLSQLPERLLQNIKMFLFGEKRFFRSDSQCDARHCQNGEYYELDPHLQIRWNWQLNRINFLMIKENCPINSLMIILPVLEPGSIVLNW